MALDDLLFGCWWMAAKRIEYFEAGAATHISGGGTQLFLRQTEVSFAVGALRYLQFAHGVPDVLCAWRFDCLFCLQAS